MGTSWISRKGIWSRKDRGGGCGGVGKNPLTNYDQSNISTNVCHFWKYDIWVPTNVEITGHRTSYFVSFDTAYKGLITDKEKQQQTRPSPNYSRGGTVPWKLSPNLCRFKDSRLEVVSMILFCLKKWNILEVKQLSTIECNIYQFWIPS